jgi:predicted DNA-binding antitoxin AbrB/MazE fold protein
VIQVINATFQDGVFQPVDRVDLLPQTRVRLLVETLETEAAEPNDKMAALQHLWRTSKLNSGGDLLTREQLQRLREVALEKAKLYVDDAQASRLADELVGRLATA